MCLPTQSLASSSDTVCSCWKIPAGEAAPPVFPGCPVGHLSCQACEIGVRSSGFSQNIKIHGFSSKCNPAYFSSISGLFQTVYIDYFRWFGVFFVMIFDVKELKCYVRCQVCWGFMMRVTYGLYWRWQFMEAKMMQFYNLVYFLFNFVKKKNSTEVNWTVGKSFVIWPYYGDFPIINFTFTAFFCLLACSFYWSDFIQ